MLQRIKVHNPYGPAAAPIFTHRATTPRLRRQWADVYRSARARGYSEGRSIAQASGVVKRNKRHGTRPTSSYTGHILRHDWISALGRPLTATEKSILRHQRKATRKNGSFSRASPNPLLSIGKEKLKEAQRALKYAQKYGDRAQIDRAKREVQRIRRTYTVGKAKNSILADVVAGDVLLRGWEKTKKFAKKVSSRKAKKPRKGNPHLALIGAAANPKKGASTMAKRRARNAKGRFVRASSVKRRANPKRRHKNAAPKVRTRTRTKTVVKYRNRYIKGAAMKANRHHRRHHHRRNPALKRRTRRNPSLQSLTFGFGAPMVKTILIAGAGAFVGSKAVSIVPNLIFKNSTDSNTNTIVKIAIGVVGTGLSWKANPSFGLGFGLGAFASWTDQLFNWLWGFQSTYTGISGLAEYQNPGYKLETPGWGSLPAAGASTAGMGAMRRTL